MSASEARVGINRPTEGTRPNRRLSTTRPQASSVMTAPTWLWMIAPRPAPIAPHKAAPASPPSVSSRMSPLLSTTLMPRPSRIADPMAKPIASAEDPECDTGHPLGDEL